MPYNKYMIYVRDLKFKKPKRTLAREKKAMKDKCFLINNDSDNLSIYKRKKTSFLLDAFDIEEVYIFY